MFSKTWVVIYVGCGGVCLACAEAEEQNAQRESPRDAGAAGQAMGGVAAAAGKSASGGTISSQGGKSGAASGGAGGARAGAANAGRAGSEPDSAGEGSGGTSGSGSGSGGGGVSGGGQAGSSSAGTSSAGSSTAGTNSTGAGCQVEAAAGAGTSGEGGAAALAPIFGADFETGAATAFTATLGTWAVIDDGSKVYEQSLLQNKLQIAVADGVCATDQIIDARIKITDFGGASNSYGAALFGRVVSATTHYLLVLGSDKKLALRKRVNTSGTSATAIGAAANLTFAEGTWYDVHFEIIGTSLKGCVGDVCVTGSDSSIASGSIAVGTVNTTARFDELRVTSP